MRLWHLTIDTIKDLFHRCDIAFSGFLDELPCNYVYIPDIVGVYIDARTHLSSSLVSLAGKGQS